MIHRAEHVPGGRTRLRGDTPSGQALVEFGLVIGLFLLVIGGLVQFGIILWSQNAINDISRDTARWAVTQSSSPCDSTAARTAVAATANQLARRATLINYTSGTWSTASTISSLGDEGLGVDPDPVSDPDVVLEDRMAAHADVVAQPAHLADEGAVPGLEPRPDVAPRVDHGVRPDLGIGSDHGGQVPRAVPRRGEAEDRVLR